MRKQNGKSTGNANDIHEHYDFDYATAKPNRFADKLHGDTVVVVLEPDVAYAFPTTEAVNEALRLVMKLSTIPATKIHD